MYLCCNGQTVVNVATGIYSTKRESDGLYLYSSSSFRPIEALTTMIHVTSRSAVFVHYQIAIDDSYNYGFWSKLQVSQESSGVVSNAGSLVHSGNQQYKTASSYWMADLDPGYYRFEVHYRSPITIITHASSDYQTAVINIMWFHDGSAVAGGIPCYSNRPSLRTYNVLLPIRDLEISIFANSRAVIAAYQLSVSQSGNREFSTRLNINNQQQESTISTKGYGRYLDMHSLWFKYLPTGDYYFGLTYKTAYTTYFEDCQNNYYGNQNLYALALPSKCSVAANVNPSTTLSLSAYTWDDTDLTYTMRVRSTNHVIVRYQYTAPGRRTYTKTRLAIALAGSTTYQPLKHTASISGNVNYASNSGMWQGHLPSGRHTITVQHFSSSVYSHTPSEVYTRAMDILYCN